MLLSQFSACFIVLCSWLYVECKVVVEVPRLKLLDDRPIIGILAQKSEKEISKLGRTFIPASYIKYIESAGGRVAPIRNNLTEKEIKTLFSSINGVLFPGGDVDLWTSGYARTASIIFYLALKVNDGGDVFPLWGTCLGFQMLNVLAAKGKDVLTRCHGENISLPLNFTKGYKNSKMFGPAPQAITDYLGKLPITLNMHQNCVSTETYHKEKSLSNFFRLLSTNMDTTKKIHFASTLEAIHYPFFGTQWHPEKNRFEWTREEVINHSQEAVLSTQYMANFFVNQARQSTHRFPSKTAETSALIYRDEPVTCLPDVTHYEQCYFF